MNKSREYSSPVLDRILSEIDTNDQLKTDKRMILALKIYNAMQAKGWNKGDLAREMNKHTFLITQWLSGMNNFSIETLFDLEMVLGITLIAIDE